MLPLNNHHFYKYAKCPAWIAHELHNPAAPEDTLRLRLQEDDLLPEFERKRLEARGTEIKDAGDVSFDDTFKKTEELMKEGVQTIYRPTLTTTTGFAQPDFLERVEGASKLGAYYYVAGDIKRSHRLKNEYKILGCFYAEALADVQGVKPVYGYVLTGNDEIVAYALAEHEVSYRLAKDALIRIVQGEEEEHFLTSDCKQSPWFSTCVAQTRATDDLSLMNRIWKNEVDAIKKAGITTVHALAHATQDELFRKIASITKERMHFLHLQAKALSSNTMQVLTKPDLPQTKQCIVVDIESDPLRDVDYLFGVLHVDENKVTYEAFFANNPEEEEQVWNAFLEHMRPYISYPIFHYGSSEQDTFRRLAKKYHSDPEIISMLEEQGVDVLMRMREAIIFPLPFYSLKDIAKYFGFSWRNEAASGVMSVMWYEAWMTHADVQAKKETITYNEDDVRATLHVIRALE